MALAQAYAQPFVSGMTGQPDAQVAALKLPPHSIEAEQSLLGGLLLDNNAGISPLVADVFMTPASHPGRRASTLSTPCRRRSGNQPANQPRPGP